MQIKLKLELTPSPAPGRVQGFARQHPQLPKAGRHLRFQGLVRLSGASGLAVLQDGGAALFPGAVQGTRNKVGNAQELVRLIRHRETFVALEVLTLDGGLSTRLDRYKVCSPQGSTLHEALQEVRSPQGSALHEACSLQGLLSTRAEN